MCVYLTNVSLQIQLCKQHEDKVLRAQRLADRCMGSDRMRLASRMRAVRILLFYQDAVKEHPLVSFADTCGDYGLIHLMGSTWVQVLDLPYTKDLSISTTWTATDDCKPLWRLLLFVTSPDAEQALVRKILKTPAQHLFIPTFYGVNVDAYRMGHDWVIAWYLGLRDRLVEFVAHAMRNHDDISVRIMA